MLNEALRLGKVKVQLCHNALGLLLGPQSPRDNRIDSGHALEGWRDAATADAKLQGTGLGMGLEFEQGVEPPVHAWLIQ